MPRKTKEVVITEDGRDKGKVFIITEPSSYESEQIALHFLNVTTRKDAVADEGMAGVAKLLNPANPESQQLLARLMTCVTYQHAPGHKPQVIREGEECQIEEVATRMQLKTEAFQLITGFSLAG